MGGGCSCCRHVPFDVQHVLSGAARLAVKWNEDSAVTSLCEIPLRQTPLTCKRHVSLRPCLQRLFFLKNVPGCNYCFPAFASFSVFFPPREARVSTFLRDYNRAIPPLSTPLACMCANASIFCCCFLCGSGSCYFLE